MVSGCVERRPMMVSTTMGKNEIAKAMRSDPGAEPHDQHGCDRRFRDRLERDEQRIERHLGRPRIDDQRAERQPDHSRQNKAEHEFVRGHHAHVHEHREFRDRGRKDLGRWRQNERRNIAVARRDLPDYEQDNRGDARIEVDGGFARSGAGKHERPNVAGRSRRRHAQSSLSSPKDWNVSRIFATYLPN